MLTAARVSEHHVIGFGWFFFGPLGWSRAQRRAQFGSGWRLVLSASARPIQSQRRSSRGLSNHVVRRRVALVDRERTAIDRAGGEPMKTPVGTNYRATWACRPTPAQVAAILSNLEPTGSVVRVPALVAALRRETGCSRATAYRALSEALASGEIKRADAS